MFIEKKMIDALSDFANGLDVRVMSDLVDGTAMFERLSLYFPEGTRFLVDVPEEAAAPVETPEEEPIPDHTEPKEEILVPIQQPKSKKQIVRELMEQGLTNQEIIKKTGFNDNTVYQVRYEMKKEKGEYPTGAQF